MTYKKPLKRFSGTTLMGVSISAVDTATSRIGSDAISSFEAHKTIKTEAENRKMLTPFHAVKSAQYGVSTEDAERTDPYCGGGTDTDTVTITFAIDGEYIDITPLDSIGNKDGRSCDNQKPNPITVPKGYVIETPPSCGVENGYTYTFSDDLWYTGNSRGENPITFPYAITENVRITQFMETPEG